MLLKFRTKSCPVEAAQWQGASLVDAISFCALHDLPKFTVGQIAIEFGLIVPTHAGDRVAQMGDWIIKSQWGEFTICKRRHFNKKYVEA